VGQTQPGAAARARDPGGSASRCVTGGAATHRAWPTWGHEYRRPHCGYHWYNGVVVRFRLLLAAGALVLVWPAAALASDWTGYFGDTTHRSASPETAITPANAASLHVVWQWSPPASAGSRPRAQLFASPTVANGRVFVGSNSGVFYARDEASGAGVWSRNLGFVSALTCSARGITATASVAGDPARGGAATVYVTGADARLWALDAATGAVVWKRQLAPLSSTQNAYYGWSSPTVVAGHVYVGLASQCDNPLVRGGVVEVDQSSGRVLHRYWSVPSGSVGASVWSSVAASRDGASVYATTGNGDEIPGHDQGDSYAIVRLDGTTMKRLSLWSVPGSARPADSDFGASPALFTASLAGTPTGMVAACNKDGILYAWKAAKPSAGPVWKTPIDTGSDAENCLAAAIVDANHLYQAGGATTIAGSTVAGTVSQLDPVTGGVLWRTVLPGAVLGTGSIDAAGVLAIPLDTSGTSTGGGVELLAASTGAILARIGTANEFAQPVFANGRLLVATIGGGLTAYAPAP
jgi:outer membrane protein assembly factor BamB